MMCPRHERGGEENLFKADAVKEEEEEGRKGGGGGLFKANVVRRRREARKGLVSASRCLGVDSLATAAEFRVWGLGFRLL